VPKSKNDFRGKKYKKAKLDPKERNSIFSQKATIKVKKKFNNEENKLLDPNGNISRSFLILFKENKYDKLLLKCSGEACCIYIYCCLFPGDAICRYYFVIFPTFHGLLDILNFVKFILLLSILELEILIK
jgi:hypothetical protein